MRKRESAACGRSCAVGWAIKGEEGGRPICLPISPGRTRARRRPARRCRRRSRAAISRGREPRGPWPPLPATALLGPGGDGRSALVGAPGASAPAAAGAPSVPARSASLCHQVCDPPPLSGPHPGSPPVGAPNGRRGGTWPADLDRRRAPLYAGRTFVRSRASRHVRSQPNEAARVAAESQGRANADLCQEVVRVWRGCGQHPRGGAQARHERGRRSRGPNGEPMMAAMRRCCLGRYAKGRSVAAAKGLLARARPIWARFYRGDGRGFLQN
jgi:hypothetical protein